MKVKNSDFLESNKQLLKKLLDELLSRYDYASILANDSVSRNFSVSKMGTNINEDTVLTERGFCVKIYDKGQACEFSFNSISEDAIPSLLKEIEDRLIPLEKAYPDGVTPYIFEDISEDTRNCLSSFT